MIFIINIILLFIYIYVVLSQDILNISEGDILMQKTRLFIAVAIFQAIARIIDNVMKRCQIHMKSIIKNSIYTALWATIGYTLYTEALLSNVTKNILNESTKKIQVYIPEQSEVLIPTIMTTFFIVFVKLFEFMMHEDDVGCKEKIKIVRLNINN